MKMGIVSKGVKNISFRNISAIPRHSSSSTTKLASLRVAELQQPPRAQNVTASQNATTRHYMTEAAYKALPQNVKALAACVVQPVQAKMYCHLATGKNFDALRDPSLRHETPNEGDFVGNEAIINNALKNGHAIHVRGTCGLASKDSIYSYEGSHSLLLIGMQGDKYIAYDPDHTHHPITQKVVEKLADDNYSSPDSVRPAARFMLRTISADTLANLKPEIIDDDALPIITGDLPDLTKEG